MVLSFPNARPPAEGEGFHIPVIADGTYAAGIVEVDDGEFVNRKGEKVTKFLIDWMLDAEDGVTSEPVQLRQFLSIPFGLMQSGYVSPKSNLYAFLKVMGIDPDAESFAVEPLAWVGKEALVLVENRTAEIGKNAGVSRPEITNVIPIPRSVRGATAANASVAAQNAQQSDWQALAVAMRDSALVKADMEPLMGGFSESHLLTWLLEEEGRSPSDLINQALALKAEARRVMAAATT